MKRQVLILRTVHHIFYFLGGFVDIVQGIFVILSFGFWKINWSIRWAAFSAITYIRISQRYLK